MTATVKRTEFASEVAGVGLQRDLIAPSRNRPAAALTPSVGAPPLKSGGRILRYAFAAVMIAVLSFGAVQSSWGEFTPEEGVGYWLGIIGGSLLLFLLAYPLRKRFRFMSRLGSAPAWFRIHMVLGTVGPVIILYHCNFSLGATNSNVALFTMIAVAASGITGRYIYGKIHNGLYGARSDIHDLLDLALPLVSRIEADLGGAEGSIAAKMSNFGNRALTHRSSLLSSLFMALSLAISSRYFRSRILTEIRSAIARNAVKNGWTKNEAREHYSLAREQVASFIFAVTKASELSLYERLFSYWRIFHVPLFFLLFITAVGHVVSVHLY